MYFIRGEDKSKDGDDNRAVLTMDKFTDPHRLEVCVCALSSRRSFETRYMAALAQNERTRKKDGEKEGKKDGEMRRKERPERRTPFAPRENTRP